MPTAEGPDNHPKSRQASHLGGTRLAAAFAPSSAAGRMLRHLLASGGNGARAGRTFDRTQGPPSRNGNGAGTYSNRWKPASMTRVSGPGGPMLKVTGTSFGGVISLPVSVSALPALVVTMVPGTRDIRPYSRRPPRAHTGRMSGTVTWEHHDAIHDELELALVLNRLLRQHPEVSPDHVGRLVSDAAESLATARIHHFLPLLIERRVTNELFDEQSKKENR